jgi:hypothetical protein
MLRQNKLARLSLMDTSTLVYYLRLRIGVERTKELPSIEPKFWLD